MSTQGKCVRLQPKLKVGLVTQPTKIKHFLFNKNDMHWDIFNFPEDQGRQALVLTLVPLHVVTSTFKCVKNRGKCYTLSCV